jgi:glycine hydroxymethyltransferase
LLFDAAHVCGLIAGGVWPNPLAEGADLMTMSTYKSLGGPAGGLVLTNSDHLAERIDAIAYPGLTANFDVSVTAALAIALLDWIDHGAAYGAEMVASSTALASTLAGHGLPVSATASHQFVVDAAAWGDGDAASRHLRLANLLTSGIGLPGRDGAAGIRFGTPEIVRRGMTAADMPELGGLVHRALTGDPAAVAADVTAFRQRFTGLRFVRA